MTTMDVVTDPDVLALYADRALYTQDRMQEVKNLASAIYQLEVIANQMLPGDDPLRDEGTPCVF